MKCDFGFLDFIAAVLMLELVAVMGFMLFIGVREYIKKEKGK